MTVLTDAARRTIAEHETLVLSDRDPAVFFDALINPPKPSERLQRAFAEHKRRVMLWIAKRPSADLQIVLLNEQHDRASFTCGVESLDRYIKTQAGQDVRRKANAVFVLSEKDAPAHILGYYTLCAMAISQGDVPETARKHIPRYPLVSATLIGRLAVSKDRQGQRLGAVLLADALQRTFESAGTVGSSMVVVDALDEGAAGFYAAHGFVRLPDSLRLVLPMRLADGSAERWA
jgi:predicted GNAT family N-acyltransferase